MTADVRPKTAALLIGLGAAATIVGAWIFEYLGYAPCPLCLTQRWFYYATIPLALVLFGMTGKRTGLVRAGLVVCGLIMIGSAGTGTYHAGVEWGFWEGPQGCAGGGGLSEGGVLPDLDNLNVVSCTEPAWTLFGISLAGYNVLISLALSAIALWGARANARVSAR